MKRLIIVGLDGGTFDIIEPLIKKGELPNIQYLIENGVSGKLKSTVPPITAAAWVSFMTGKNPGKTDVLHFRKYNLSSYDGYAPELISSENIKGQTFLDILSKNNFKVISIGLPMTYPPFPINGIMISGFPYPSLRKAPVYPDELENEFGIWNEVKDPSEFNEPSIDAVKSLQYWTEKFIRVSKNILENNDFNLFILVFSGIDHASHLFWKYMSNNYEEFDKFDVFKNVIKEQYKKADDFVGYLLKKYSNNTDFMIISDHGFGKNPETYFNLNIWLRNNGYLSIKSTDQRISKRFGNILFKFRDNISRIWWEKIRSIVPDYIKKTIYNKISDAELINWEETKAYRIPLFTTIDGININLKNRQSKGIVDINNEYDKLRDEIINKLKNIKSSEGLNIIKDVGKKEKYFEGPFLDNIPDIIVIYNEFIASGDKMNGELICPVEKEKLNRISGQHRIEGVFIAYGNTFKRNIKIEQIKLIDIPKMILYYFGIPIPPDWDGDIKENIFNKVIKHNHEFENNNKQEEKNIKKLSKEEEAAIKNRLKNLGYL